jgi:hypothetical protein
MKATRLSEITAQMEVLRSEKSAIDAANFKDSITPILERSIGKTFVYRNNTHGHGGFWDSYRRLTAVSFSKLHAWLIFENCSVNSDGVAQIETRFELIHRDSTVALPQLERGWEECPLSEYQFARATTLAELQSPTKAIAYLEER